MRSYKAALTALSLGALCLMATEAARAVDAFHVYLRPALPDTAFVYLGESLGLSLEVDSSAQHFNAYQVTVRFDPDVIAADSVSEGSLFTEACSSRFVETDIGDSTVTYTHVLLCAGVSVNGPGVLSTFWFHPSAAGSSPATIVSPPDESFFDDGYYVWPQHPTRPRQVVFHDALIRVLEGSSAVDPRDQPPGTARLHLQVAPNPAGPGSAILFRLQRPALVSLDIVEVTGRLVWHLERAMPPGCARVSVPVPLLRRGGLAAATHFCRIRVGERQEAVPFQIVR